MRTRMGIGLFLAALILMSLLPREVMGIPVFARKYGFNCTMCHSTFPRLNDFGQRFRANGYRLPGKENEEKTVLETPAPVALRVSSGYNSETYTDVAGSRDLSALQMNGLDLLSAGTVGRKIGFVLVYVPQVAASRGVVGQDGSLETASLAFSNVASTWLNARVGRYEPAYVPFSVKRQLSAAPYEIYDVSFPGGPTFSQTQSGVELSGRGRSLFQYAAGVVTGSEINVPRDNPTDVYARAACIIGPGEGQTTGQRIGMVGYFGKSRPAAASTQRLSFSRLGGDVSLNAAHMNLALQYLYGRDGKGLWPGATDRTTWSGGFAELSWLPRVDVAAFARFDRVDAPSIDNKDVSRATVGGRYYFEDNVALHLEYSYRTIKSVTPGVDDGRLSFVTTRVDVAF